MKIISTNQQWKTKEKRKHTVWMKHLSKHLKTNYIKKNVPKNNLTNLETKALKDLSIKGDIIITTAEKDGAVIIDVDNYINEAN